MRAIEAPVNNDIEERDYCECRVNSLADTSCATGYSVRAAKVNEE